MIVTQNLLLRFVSVVLFLIVSVTSFGQTLAKRFKHLTIEDGLPQNMVDCMLQDRHGFMWFGTWNGLCRYDGYSFELFDGIYHSTNSLRTNFIHTLQEDQFGNIWIGTKQGLHAYLYDEGQFLRIENKIPQGNKSTYADVRSLDFYQDSVLLVGSDRGLSVFVVESEYGQLTLRKHYEFGSGKDQLHGNIVNAILSDSQNNIWIGTNSGLMLLNQSGELLAFDATSQNGLLSNKILSLFESKDGEIWLGTDVGLYQFDLRSRFYRGYFHDTESANSLPHNTVLDIREDDKGNLLLATLGGFSIFNRNNNQFSNYKEDVNQEHSLGNDFVNSLLVDHFGNIWIGTERGGVSFFNTNQNQIEHFEMASGSQPGLTNSTINSVFEDDKYLWIGTAGGGLNRFHSASGKFSAYLHDPQNLNSPASDFVTAIHRDKKGRLWIAYWGAGLDIMREDGKGFVHHQSPEHAGLVSNFISSIEEDEFGNLWIGTLGGLSRFDAIKNEFETVFQANTEPGITEVGCLLLDQQNNLWVGSRYGLYHLDFQNGKNLKQPIITKYEHGAASGTLSGDYVISLRQSTDGTLYIGTYGQGLNKLVKTESSVSFENFGLADGFSNTIIYGIEEDRDANLWLSTDYGLTRFNPKTRNVRNFFTSDGLLNNQYYWSATYKNQSGKLFFGGMNGLDAFFTNWIQDEVIFPEVVITDIKLLNESIKPHESYNGVEVMNQSPFTVKEMELSYKEKVLSIEFTSLNYQETGNTRYAYILEGFEKDWNYVPSNRRFATYTNLRPGDYTFRVKASMANDQFNAEARTIHIYIAPPFWETAWFRIMLLLMLVGVVIAYTRFKVYSLRRQKLILERQVQERTERINQQNEALSFQAIQLRNNNKELEDKQSLIEGQNHQLENQNKEILSQRDELISLNRKLNLVSQLKLSFFTNISHEFRTPLTLILGPLERLIKENSFTSEVKENLTIMNRNAQRLLHLINQIMDFRKIEKGKMELRVTQGNMSEFCKSLFEAFQPLAEIKKIQFTYESSDLPKDVWFDVQKLENILYNLLSNAFKYTKDGGSVYLKVKGLTVAESRLKEAGMPAEDAKHIISISIRDTGIGISEDHLPLVFKRFYRIESEDAFRISGSGIGLALTEELIKTHHGKIFVESEPGVGSTFEIQFPCLKGDYQDSEVTENQALGLDVHQQVELLKTEMLLSDDKEKEELEFDPEDNRPLVLVVEDSLDLRNFITHRLRKTYKVLEAENGYEALQLSEQYAPEIIISDVMMPKMDGLELCAKIKGNFSTSHIPFILLTAKSTIEDQLEGLQLGADDYLPKPFNFELLEIKIQNFIESRRKLRGMFVQSPEFNVQEATTNTKDQKFLEKAIEMVEERMSDSDFGVKEFVEEMGISRSLLHKKLTSLTDQSAAEFLNHLRMKRAKKLLKSGEMNISEVAYAVGYNDPKYFSRLFSKHFGQSPSEFQEISTF